MIKSIRNFVVPFYANATDRHYLFCVLFDDWWSLSVRTNYWVQIRAINDERCSLVVTRLVESSNRQCNTIVGCQSEQVRSALEISFLEQTDDRISCRLPSDNTSFSIFHLHFSFSFLSNPLVFFSFQLFHPAPYSSYIVGSWSHVILDTTCRLFPLRESSSVATYV